jgi:hypothetical protein
MNQRVLLLFCLGLVSLCGGEDRFWEKQEASTFTPEQVTQFTTASPWAKQVTAVLTSNDSNMAGGAPHSGGVGRRGGGVGRGGSSSSTSPSMPKWEAIVRWVSAPPMQQLLKPKLPDSFKGHYVISVTGLPIGEDPGSLTEQTSLTIKRGQEVHPETAYQDPNDTATLYFAFLPSMVDASNSKTAQFKMEAPPFEVKTKFNLGEMKIHGEPSL